MVSTTAGPPGQEYVQYYEYEDDEDDSDVPHPALVKSIDEYDLFPLVNKVSVGQGKNEEARDRTVC